MGNVILKGFSLVPHFSPKRKTQVKEQKDKVVSKLLYCICVLQEGEFMAHINTKGTEDFEDIVCLPFTEESKSCKGKNKVFNINPTSYGDKICIMRNEDDMRHTMPTEQYTPFRNNYVYSGKIVRINGKHYFNIEECFNHVHYSQTLINNDKLLKLFV